MTSLPAKPPQKRLGLLIDLDVCVGCHACAVSCKEWNTGGYPAPLSDENAYGDQVSGVWLNRVHGFEVASGADAGRTVHFPKSCLHCEDAPCVTVCPTGASYKRAEDGIVLVDEDLCIGCKLCSWACPYGAREFDRDGGVMKKCTLCIDRIYNENLAEEERVPACVSACPTTARFFGDFNDPDSQVSQLKATHDGYELLPEMGLRATNTYLALRPNRSAQQSGAAAPALETAGGGFLAWVDRVLSN